MELVSLVNELDKLSQITNQEWMASLSSRKQKELEFHDRDRDLSFQQSINQDAFEQFYGNVKYYDTVKRSNDYTEKWLKTHAKDKIFLDYCCGNGDNAIKAAKYGAKLAIGVDISNVSVQNAKRLAKAAGVEKNTYFVQGDAENTRLPDDSIDAILCCGVLHHLDLSYGFPELRRILRPGGRILAVESLDYNPIIKLYRYLTPKMRTDWEKAHILSLKDIKFAKRFFNIGEVKYWHITSYFSAHCKPLYPVLNFIDDISTKIPLLKLMAWIFTFELIKNNET